MTPRSILLLLAFIVGLQPLFSQHIHDAGYPFDLGTANLLYPAPNRNSSLLLGINPGDMNDYMSQKDFSAPSLVQFNQFGSFGLRNNGLQTNVNTDHYRFTATYGYINFDGYREHSNEYGQLLNIGMKSMPTSHSSLAVLGYYYDGRVRMPGSLTASEFAVDPFMADQRSVDRDDRRSTRRIGTDIRYNAKFGRTYNNEIEVNASGRVEMVERLTEEFKLIDRYSLGISAKYKNTTMIGSRKNEVSFGAEMYLQPQATEYYENWGGIKSDQIEQLHHENVRNAAGMLTDKFAILPGKLDFQLTGRYDREVYDINEEILPSRSDKKTFQDFTPKAVLNYYLKPEISVFGSYRVVFRGPTEKELESPYPAFLYNNQLNAQTSGDAELGLKAEVKDSTKLVVYFRLEASFLYQSVNNVIVPYEVFREEYFRNASGAERVGFKLKARVEFRKILDLSVSYTYAHNRYSTYTTRAIEEVDSNIVFVDRDFSGKTEPGVPASNLLLTVGHEHRFSSHITGFARVSYQAMGGLWVDDANSAKTDAVNLLDALIGLNGKFGHFNLMVRAGINNMFDAVYVGYTTSNSAEKRFYNPGTPRNYFCSVNFGYVF